MIAKSGGGLGGLAKGAGLLAVGGAMHMTIIAVTAL
jgi:hypothetical protein